MLNGEYAKLYDFNNEGPIIVNFWTTWWSYCERQLAYIDQLNSHFKDYGLTVLAVNTNKSNILSLVRPYINKRKYKFKVAVDPRSELAKEFGVLGYPTLFIIDENGTIIHKSSGYEEGLEEKYLESLLNYYKKQGTNHKEFEYNRTSIVKNKNTEINFDFWLIINFNIWNHINFPFTYPSS